MATMNVRARKVKAAILDARENVAKIGRQVGEK